MYLIKPVSRLDCEYFYQSLTDEKKTKLNQFCQSILLAKKTINITGFKTIKQIHEKFVLESTIPNIISTNWKYTNCLDIGSGAGIPGFILAIINSKLNLYSLDKSPKKADFQKKMIKQLNLPNVKILNDNILNLMPNKKFDLIISRAFKDINQTINKSQHLLATGGNIMLWKGKKWKEEWDFFNDSKNKKIFLNMVYRYEISRLTGGYLLMLSKHF